MWYTRCPCTDVSLFEKVQEVLGKEVVEALVRDFVVLFLCGPNSLLVVLLWPLLIGVSHLFPL